MRILHIDIDSLRPDHLGCYGYHRDTSPNIDAIAAQGARFSNCFASDVPCLPSRTALFTGRFGIHNGVVNHGGTASEPFIEGPGRGFKSALNEHGWMGRMRKAGYSTHAISPFGERHASWQWHACFNEVINPGKSGHETVEDVEPLLSNWLDRNAARDDWFCYVNLWDVHTPYRVPPAYGEPFANEPLPGWLTQDVIDAHWQQPGVRSAQDAYAFLDSLGDRHPRNHRQVADLDDARKMFDGYDTAVRYVDDMVGRIVAQLEAQGILDDTAIIISADHGEDLGELNCYASHRTADHCVGRVPMIIKWPGVLPRAFNDLCYHLDAAATITELAGGTITERWDGVSRAEYLTRADIQPHEERECIVVGQLAQAAQRSVFFRHEDKLYMCMRSWHCGFGNYPERMLFNLTDDPHEEHDLADDRPDMVAHAMTLYDRWLGEQMRRATHFHDPLWTVLEQGPAPTRGTLPRYLDRLRATEREGAARQLESRYPHQAKR